MNALELLIIVTFVAVASWPGLLPGTIENYALDYHRGVEIRRTIHGFPIIAFGVTLAITAAQVKWPFGKTTIACLESVPTYFYPASNWSTR